MASLGFLSVGAGLLFAYAAATARSHIANYAWPTWNIWLFGLVFGPIWAAAFAWLYRS